ncbi:hypothetical protein CTAM01_13892 [Colletotrichum tamarilloi]|uniref:Uncharacterized protein n=1 Tax=Colletotrichum tamarilloi TaxID=1209934 RepID=A0ABQ9QQX5_9PEZI|nr:uncharacterized protein CTAM01_13892 [Colletotrichum tamarilloi]KAK1481732.1 hypothetical protein CTAM01_13892 [Colletotrichum tamarilloi]
MSIPCRRPMAPSLAIQECRIPQSRMPFISLSPYCKASLWKGKPSCRWDRIDRASHNPGAKISVHLYGCYVKKDHPSDMLPLYCQPYSSREEPVGWKPCQPPRLDGKGRGHILPFSVWSILLREAACPSSIPRTIGEETHMWKQAIRQQEGNKVDVPVSQTGETGSRAGMDMQNRRGSEDVQLGACRTPNKRSGGDLPRQEALQHSRKEGGDVNVGREGGLRAGECKPSIRCGGCAQVG